MKKSFLVFLVTFVAACFAGCGGDSNPSDPDANNDPPPPPGRATIDSLITAYFPYYYSRRDSAMYDAMLLGGFQFQKLPSDPDDPVEDLLWDEIEENRIAGRMFRGARNGFGQAVGGIALQIRDLTITPSDHPDEPAGAEWFEVDAFVELQVIIDDPSQSDGSGRLSLEAKTPQTFLVAADPLSPGEWGLVRQIDRAPLAPRTAGGAATEETSWGAVKDLFR